MVTAAGATYPAATGGPEEKRSALDAKMRLPRHAKSQPVSARQVRRDRCDQERPAANAEKGAIASNLELGAIAIHRPS